MHLDTEKVGRKEKDWGVTQAKGEDDEFVCIDENNIDEGIHSSDCED